MSLIVEILGGALSGQGCGQGERQLQSNGVIITVYRIEHFVERSFYDEELEAMIAHLLTSRVAPGFEEILLPGEPEYRTARAREQEGIEIDAMTWSRIGEAARQLGLDPEKWHSVGDV